MITLKSPREIEEMAKSGAILAGMHIGLREIIKPGISSWEIENLRASISRNMAQLQNKSDLKVINTQRASASTMKFAMGFHERT